MNPNEAAQVLHVLTSAWPWAEWPDSTIELWMVALAPHDREHAVTAARRAVRELDRPPTIAWFHHAAVAERDRDNVYVPELTEGEVSPERGAELARLAREALRDARRAAS